MGGVTHLPVVVSRGDVVPARDLKPGIAGEVLAEGACQILCGRVGVTSTAWGRGAWRITHDFRTDNNECNDDDGR
jgi:hypothetical protein